MNKNDTVIISDEKNQPISLRGLGTGVIIGKEVGTLSQPNFYLVEFESETLSIAEHNLSKVFFIN
jgi:hypothetical protein